MGGGDKLRRIRCVMIRPWGNVCLGTSAGRKGHSNMASSSHGPTSLASAQTKQYVIKTRQTRNLRPANLRPPDLQRAKTWCALSRRRAPAASYLHVSCNAGLASGVRAGE